jgi:hypothetical protein
MFEHMQTPAAAPRRKGRPRKATTVPPPTRINPGRATRPLLLALVLLLAPPSASDQRIFLERPDLPDLHNEVPGGGDDVAMFHVNNYLTDNNDRDVPMIHIDDNIIDSQEHDINGRLSSCEEEEESDDHGDSSDGEVRSIDDLG